jgi:hypothetical protein
MIALIQMPKAVEAVAVLLLAKTVQEIAGTVSLL